MPWTAAIALGAIVAPPDAAAATTVLKQLRPPHRLLVILEGESLFNDASALIIYRLAVAATVSGFVSGWSVLPDAARRHAGQRRRSGWCSLRSLLPSAAHHDVPTAIVFQFCQTFAVWVLAERLHLSGIITMVVFAMAASRRAPEVVPARIRIPSWAVWEVAVFVLNVLAFILVGFQLRSIAARAPERRGAVRRGRGDGLRRRDPRADRLGDGRRGAQPLALPPHAEGSSGPRDAVGLCAPPRPSWAGAACGAL